MVLVALFLLQLVAYSYLFTEMTLTNHTLPNTLVSGYPSYRTSGEGRWLADFIIFLQGGSGVQSLQMTVAALLQAFNGVLFSRLVGLSSRWEVFLVSAILCLFPAFLDYYSFAVDHVSFVIGDSFVIAGACAWVWGQHLRFRIMLTSGFYLLALSTYAPKIMLISVFILLSLILILTVHRARHQADPSQGWQRLIRESLLLPLPMLLSVMVFWFSTKLLILEPIFPRTHLNDLAQALQELSDSYRVFLTYLGSEIGGLPPGFIGWIPLLLLGFGVFALLSASCRDRRFQLVLIVAIMLLPVAAHASKIINIYTPTHSGRFFIAYGYVLVFFLALALQRAQARVFAVPLACLLLWFLFTFAAQQTNAAQLKTTYELSMINRILARVEPMLGDHEDDDHPIVVIGRYPPFKVSDFVRWPSRMDAPHLLSTEAFAHYRQPELLNLLLGRRLVHSPSPAERDSAIRAASGVATWPSASAVFLDGRTVVVALQHFSDDVPVTLSTGER
ncbi:glucosyltransferase domain-containing protein [Cyanobium sp. BSA11S]|uniref:glucosyltransferase domain-containing protein n=1 Tax=Cyanobium sp. BSA11S TaxID=3108224 RepID=UPI003D81BD37